MAVADICYCPHPWWRRGQGGPTTFSPVPESRLQYKGGPSWGQQGMGQGRLYVEILHHLVWKKDHTCF